MSRYKSWIGASLCALALLHISPSHGQALPKVNSLAAPFALTDAGGKRHSLSDFRGKPVLLCFFCGCEPCHKFAHAWAQIQHGEQVSGTQTIVIFLGISEDLRKFASETNLDLGQTTLLPDPSLDVALKYSALPCPRLYVLDEQGIIKYTNNHADGQPQTASDVTLISQCVTAIRNLPTASSTVFPGDILALSTTAPKNPIKMVRDLGTVDRVVAPQIEQHFFLRNDTASAITIEKIQPTCGCAAALIPPAFQADTNILAAGKGADIKVTMDLRGLRPGVTAKQVWVYAKGNPSPLAMMELKLKLEPTIEFSVPSVDFGRVPAGNARSIVIAAAADSRLVVGGWPRPVCSHPDVEISPGTDSISIGGPVRKRSYTVTLPANARLGSLAGTISFLSGGVKAVGRDSDETAFLGGASVTLAGEVAGPISVSPGSAVFGTLAAGLEANQRVIILGEDAHALEGLFAESGNTHVLVHLSSVEESPTASNPRGAALALTIRLLKTRPLGALEANITLTTPKGIRLVVPIIAFTPAGAP
jgi:peroxiredoxin